MIDVMQGPVKDPGGQVLGVMDIAGAVIDVVKNPLDVTGIEGPKSFLVPLRSKDLDLTIVQFLNLAWQYGVFDHLAHLTGSLLQYRI